MLKVTSLCLYSAGACIFLFMIQFGKACLKKMACHMLKRAQHHFSAFACLVLAFHLERATDFFEYGKLRSSKKSDLLPLLAQNDWQSSRFFQYYCI